MWAEHTPRHAPSAPAWLLILALHAGVLALLNTRQQPAGNAPRDWSELRIIPARPAPTPSVASTPVTPPPSARPRTAQADPSAELAPATTPPDTAEPATADGAAAAPTPQPPAPLQLTLPDLADAARRQPALDDPRGNTPVSRFGQHIANDLGGDGRWAEERMDADTVRLRRGNTCINLHRNRTAGRQPFDEASAPTPWGATPAYRCERR